MVVFWIMIVQLLRIFVISKLSNLPNGSIITVSINNGDQFLAIFDAITAKTECANFDNQNLVTKLADRIHLFKDTLTHDYEQ